jgi:hypothetical protein
MCKACSTHEDKRYRYTILVRRPEGNRPLGRTSRRWENNFKMDLKVTGRSSMYWIDLNRDRDQDRTLVNSVISIKL